MTKSACNLEILAPAGNPDAIAAAVQNGANAVYLGQTDFSARQNAGNFNRDELKEAVSYCHARDVKVYQTLNTLIFDGQLDLLIACVKTACDCGVDALIVQDWGLVALLQDICPAMPLHASTQMAVHSVLGAKLLKEQGFTRVVLARELSLAQISEITAAVEIETEVFVHGALCMSVSGQCYISSMIGARSGNRGNCAGTCRLPFSSTDNPAHDLSLKDLCLAAHLDELKAAGVTSAKIEGRMKRPEYVAAAAGVYANANASKEYDLDTLQAVFSRSGFTDGYFTNHIGREMFGIRQKDDVIAATGGLLKSLENSYKKEIGRIPLSVTIKLKRGEPALLTAVDSNGNSATAMGEIPQEARTKPATPESVTQALQKLGGTIFLDGGISCEIEEGLMLPLSKLNEMRRAVCEKITDKRSTVSPIPCAERVIPPDTPPCGSGFTLRARFERFSQLPLERLNELEFFSLPIEEVAEHTDILLKFRDKLLIEPHRALFSAEVFNVELLKTLKTLGFSRLYATNPAHIQAGNELGYTIYGSAYLNCSNSLAATKLAEMGVVDQTLSFELALHTAVKLRASIPLGLFIYGYLPLMLFKNCPIKNQFTCRECAAGAENKILTDRMGMSFKILCNRQKYSELLNCNPLYMADRLSELSPLSFGVLYFTTEDREECARVLSLYQEKAPAVGNFTRGLYYRNVL